MTLTIETPQQALWAGVAGDEYHKRNLQTDRSGFWGMVIGDRISGIHSVFEPGAGKGDNLTSIRKWAYQNNVFPRVTGLDVNESACKVMEARGIVPIHSAFPNVEMANTYDLVLTRGFLIHLPKPELLKAIERIYEMSNRYICFVEYYSTRRRMVSYRGNRNALWTDDYAGYLLERHDGVRLLDYGFVYGEDCTWFLMEKV